MKNILLNNFLRYVKIDTMSSEEANKTPSTEKQFNLARLLIKELQALNLEDIYLSDKCFVYAKLPSNIKGNKASIGFIAHMDTIPGFSGTNVSPNVIDNYNGKAIKLKGIELNPKQFPVLENLIGKTLITTDGTTVLGADDKAGVAIIMTLLNYFVKTNEPHIDIYVAFTPDEEIGTGIENFDLERFKCQYAYTIDGGNPKTINYENFNAASAKAYIKGLDIHPGSAKGQMINASLVAMEYNQLLPVEQRPEYTDKYEGFIHLTDMKGAVGEAYLEYIIRDHSLELLKKKKEIMLRAADYINSKYGNNTISVAIKDSYKNMSEIINEHPECISRVTQAMNSLGITPATEAIRGGTDGARLTFMGLPTPNLGTGGYNCHGPYEFACLEEMEAMVNILIEISKK